MELTATLAISSLVLAAILLLAILAVIVWLQKQSSQSNRESMTFLSTLLERTMSSLSELQTSQLASLRQSSEMTTERLSSQLSSAQTQFLQHLQVQTQELATTMSTSVNQATSSVSSTARTLAELLASSQAVVAAKDPIAYQQIRGATFPFSGDDGAEPYTSTEDLAQHDAEAEAARVAGLQLAEQGLATIMSNLGVENVEPYPAAGSAGLFARSAAGTS